MRTLAVLLLMVGVGSAAPRLPDPKEDEAKVKVGAEVLVWTCHTPFVIDRIEDGMVYFVSTDVVFHSETLLPMTVQDVAKILNR